MDQKTTAQQRFFRSPISEAKGERDLEHIKPGDLFCHDTALEVIRDLQEPITSSYLLSLSSLNSLRHIVCHNS